MLKNVGLASVRTALRAAVFAGVAFAAGSAFAVEPTGLWYDHTGRGAVEITKCGNQLCGRLVWLKDAEHAKQVCGIQILGEVKPMANGAWDGGWKQRMARTSTRLPPNWPCTLSSDGTSGGQSAICTTRRRMPSSAIPGCAFTICQTIN
jgi:uncharacterized low-complexity protein